MVRIAWEFLFLLILRVTHVSLNKILTPDAAVQRGGKLYCLINKQKILGSLPLTEAVAIQLCFNVAL